jgi:hypothetical protein
MDVLCPPQWQRHDRRRQDQDQRETGRLSHTSLFQGMQSGFPVI